MKTVLCIGTLDTKGPEMQYIKEMIEKRGHTTLVMDIGNLGKPFFTPDVTAEEVAREAGSSIEEVRNLNEAGPAAEVMTRGTVKITKDLYNSGKFHGVISLGGSMGLTISSAAMRELPFGLPKLMIATQKIVQAGIRGFVETKDMTIMISIADIAGLNRLTRKTLSEAAGAIVGMMEASEPEIPEGPLVFMTMMGSTTGCGLKVKSAFEKKGFEVVVFHTVGIGGMTFEELVNDFPVKGVVELSINEIGNELFGGLSSAGPHRLEAAGKRGIPQIITPGNVRILSFTTPDTIPERYRDRQLSYHSPEATVVGLNAEEIKSVSEMVAKKLNMATGPVKVLVPTRGFSSIEREGLIFYDPVVDKAFVDTLRKSLNRAIEIKEIDAHINDNKFAEAVVHEFFKLV